MKFKNYEECFDAYVIRMCEHAKLDRQKDFIKIHRKKIFDKARSLALMHFPKGPNK